MSGPDGDELLADPGRPSTRVVAVVGLVALVLLGLAAVRLVGTDRGHRAVPRGSAPLPVAGAAVLPLDGTGDPVVAATVDAGSLLVLRTASLLRATRDGHVLRVRRLSGDDALVAQAPGVTLLVAKRVGWAVTLLERRARVLTYDPATLQPMRTWENDFIAYDAAALDGRLYVATAEGIAWLDAAGHSGHVPHVAGVVASVVADAPRHRLLAVLGSQGSSVAAVTPAGTVTAVAALHLDADAVRVIAGAPWVVGAANGRGVLTRLDPRALREVRRLVLPVPSGAALVGSDAAAAYVESTGRSGGLWCVGLRTGRTTHLSAGSPVAVAVDAPVAYAVSAPGLSRISSC